MCFGKVTAPEPIEIEKPVFVRNPFLDEDERNARSADALRKGRSSLVIPGSTGIGFSGDDASAINNLSGGGRRTGPAPVGGDGTGGSTAGPGRPDRTVPGKGPPKRRPRD